MLLVILTFLHFSSHAGRKIGLTDFVVYDIDNNYYQLYASVSRGVKFSNLPEILKFQICGKEYSIEGNINGNTKYKIKKCDLKSNSVSVSLFHKTEEKEVFYEKITFEECKPNPIFSSIIRDYDGKVSVYFADFKINQLYIIRSESGIELDRFKAILGCTYFAKFNVPTTNKTILINDKAYRISNIWEE